LTDFNTAPCKALEFPASYGGGGVASVNGGRGGGPDLGAVMELTPLQNASIVNAGSWEYPGGGVFGGGRVKPSIGVCTLG
jgi:hypothetical protein